MVFIKFMNLMWRNSVYFCFEYNHAKIIHEAT